LNNTTFAFIFARGGSKGLHRKNLLPLAGKPLIVHSIDTAFSLPCVNKVVVSTDDSEIAEVALKAGADIPFIRPTELAQDTSPEWLSWQHAISHYFSIGYQFRTFLSIPTTSPLRTSNDVNCCLKLLESSTADIVITVKDAERSPYFNMVKSTERNEVELLLDARFHRRQDSPQIYDITTVAYAARPEFILKASRIFDGSVKAVLIPRHRALDIDTPYDMSIADALFHQTDPSPFARAL
tara:strand:- start:3879 stop:4595 length:717 start_codon:yes stop_codon:yes gene_type:complete